jgi:ribosomal protein S4
MRQLTSTFSRFILSWLFHRRSKLSFVDRPNLTLPFKKTRRLKYSTVSTSFQGVVDSFDKPAQRRSPKVSQNLYLSAAPSTPIASKTLFVFRRYLTRLLQDSMPTSSSRTFRTLRKRGFIRRKRTRLPRALHFMKPYRSKAASFRSSSTFRYLFRRVLLLRRRKFFRKKSLTRLRKIGRSGTSSHRFLMPKYQINSLRRSLLVGEPTVLSIPHLKQKLVQKRTPFVSTLFWSPKNSFNVYKIYTSKRLRSKKIRKARHRRATLKTLFQSIPNLNMRKKIPLNQLVEKTLTSKTPLFKVKRCYFPQLANKYQVYIRVRLEHLNRAYKRLRYRRRSRRFFHRENAPFVRNGKRYLKLRTFHSRREGVRLLKNIFKKPQLMEQQSPAWSLSMRPSSMSDADYHLKLTRGTHLAKSSVWFKSTLRKGTTLRPTTLNHRRRLAFESLRKLPFILSATGFLYNPGFVKQISLKSTAYIRCTKYSFFDALRIKRFILKERTGRAFFAKRKIKRTIANIVPYTHRLDKTNLRRTLRDYDNEETPYYGDFLSMNPSWTLSQPWKSSPGSIHNEYNLRIRRIRFKPGYSRIWRKARTALMQVLDLNFRYQHRLTVYLGRFAHIASRVHKKLLDIRVHTLLIRSRFVFDLTTANNLVTSRLVFVNGRLVLNPRMFLFVGDVLQLIVHLKFYIVYRWLLNWYTFKTHRRARLARSKFKKVSHAQTKQRSSRLPDWLFKARSVNRDIPKFLEVDFFTLSSFIVYTPFSKNDLETLDILDSRLEVYNMYNWKYIN